MADLQKYPYADYIFGAKRCAQEQSLVCTYVLNGKKLQGERAAQVVSDHHVNFSACC